MFYEAEATYSSFLKCFCVHHQPHGIVDHKPKTTRWYSTQKPSVLVMGLVGFLVSFWWSVIGFTDGNTMCSWWWTQKTLQKWRVRGLSFIKHQTLLKNSTWAWSCVDFKKCPFFYHGNRWFLCWPKIWQWYIEFFAEAKISHIIPSS